MALIDGMLRELEDEAVTTRRVLERVPDDRLGWRPHPKARTLGELALHVAIVPGGVAQLVASPSPAQAPQVGQDPSPASSSELMPALDQSIATAKQVLGGMDDGALTATWRMTNGERELFSHDAGSDAAVGHAQPLVPSSRAADGVPARAGRPDSLHLWTECGRESVRLARDDRVQRPGLAGPRPAAHPEKENAPRSRK